MNCLRTSHIEKLTVALARGAAMELYLTPKPGLVDLFDSGSHPDLSFKIMECSVGYITDYLDEIKTSLIEEEPFEFQRKIAVRAEQRLYDNLGTNTHKGYIFLSGMLLIAGWHSVLQDEGSIRSTLSLMAEEFFNTRAAHYSNGHKARQKYNAGGIVSETLNGFPTLFEEALPAFRKAMTLHSCFRAASFAMLARLMQTVEDTTTLHRGGPLGLSRVKRDGRKLEQLVAAGDDYNSYLSDLNREYIRMNLTIGGVADMLGLAYGCLLASGEVLELSAACFDNRFDAVSGKHLQEITVESEPLLF